MCEENLHFYLACDQLDNIFSAQEFYDTVMGIYATYIANGSKSQINVSAKIVENIVAQMNVENCFHLNVKILYEAKWEIYQLLNAAVYPRFITSAIVKHLLE